MLDIIHRRHGTGHRPTSSGLIRPAVSFRSALIRWVGGPPPGTWSLVAVVALRRGWACWSFLDMVDGSSSFSPFAVATTVLWAATAPLARLREIPGPGEGTRPRS